MAKTWSADVSQAFKVGGTPERRNWRTLAVSRLTTGEKVCRFAEEFLCVPEGMHTGEPLKLDEWQEAFILAIFDNPNPIRLAICSLARRNGKSFVVAIILLAYILGPLARRNVSLASGALSRDQAALIYKLCEKTLNISPRLQGRYRCIPSYKRIVGLVSNTEYRALSADGPRNMGGSYILVLLDEAGQITGPSSPFVEMLETSQGSFSEKQRPLMIVLSTQAPSDADYLSMKIDDVIRSSNKSTVCHLYTAAGDDAMTNPKEWKKANPGLDRYRSRKDLSDQLEKALRMPTQEAAVRNLLLNQRVALDKLWLAPSVWKRNGGPPDIELFKHRSHTVALGLDLSSRVDLTAAVLAVRAGSNIHLLPFCFTPQQGLADRARRDRAPYEQWVREGKLIAVPGGAINYKYVCDFLRDTFRDLEIELSSVMFDRWRIDAFKTSANESQFATGVDWFEVGQGFKDMSPRIEYFMTQLMEGTIRHGNHPLFNMAAANAIAVRDAAGNLKLDKSKSTQRIDPLVAAVMAVYAVGDGANKEESPYLLII